MQKAVQKPPKDSIRLGSIQGGLDSFGKSGPIEQKIDLPSKLKMVKPKDGSPRTKYSDVQNEIKPCERGITGKSFGFFYGKSTVKRMK